MALRVETGRNPTFEKWPFEVKIHVSGDISESINRLDFKLGQQLWRYIPHISQDTFHLKVNVKVTGVNFKVKFWQFLQKLFCFCHKMRPDVLKEQQNIVIQQVLKIRYFRLTKVKGQGHCGH